MKQIHILNPLSDRRWDDLVARHPRASAFHLRGWLEALNQTYGYEPVVLTSTPPGEPLGSGMVFCRVSSWLTGTRLVSLPFADHCEPLVNDPGEYSEFINWLRGERDRERYKYFEVRPLSCFEDPSSCLQASHSYCIHELDVRPSSDQIFRTLHKDSIQRKIRRAERERLSCEVGRSPALVDEFFHLHLTTRRRHQLPPQPRAWFRNLVECMGGNIQVRVVRKEETPIAAMLTLRHRSTVIYKYGSSDERFHNLGAMPFLFWALIEESKIQGVKQIDFGRSDLDNEGLIIFKDRFSTTRRPLTYYRYPGKETEVAAMQGMRVIRQFFSFLPDALLSTAGRVLYRHIG